jgi:hypothetical protein
MIKSRNWRRIDWRRLRNRREYHHRSRHRRHRARGRRAPDNQIQIGHNARTAHTRGRLRKTLLTRIGYCLIMEHFGMVGHIDICDKRHHARSLDTTDHRISEYPRARRSSRAANGGATRLFRFDELA